MSRSDFERPAWCRECGRGTKAREWVGHRTLEDVDCWGCMDSCMDVLPWGELGIRTPLITRKMRTPLITRNLDVRVFEEKTS